MKTITDELISIYNNAEMLRTGRNGTINIKAAKEENKKAADAEMDVAVVTAEMLETFGGEYIPERLWTATRELILFRMRAEKFEIENISYNMTLEISAPDEAKVYANNISDVLDRIHLARNKVKLTDADAILNGTVQFSDPSLALVFISGCTDAIFRQLDKIAVIFSSSPAVTKILCLSHEQIQKLRAENEKFYFSVMGHESVNHTSATRIEDCDIFPAFMYKLTAEYTVTEEFTRKIREYIEEVYPTANNRDIAFVEELYERVIRQHLHSDSFTDVIGAECVPYSKKLENKQKNEDNFTEKKQPDVQGGQNNAPASKEISLDDLVVNKKNFDISKENKDEKTRILLLALSTINRNGMEESNFRFITEDGTEILTTGIYQLDPVPKILAEQLAGKGHYLDKIIYLYTDATDKEMLVPVTLQDNTKYTISTRAIDFFKKQISDYLRPGDDDERFIGVRINENDLAPGISKAIDIIRKSGNPELYIDTHGGFRDMSLALEAIISLAGKEINNNITVYSVYHSTDKNSKKINPVKLDETHKLFSFVSGLNEFFSFGRADSLKKYLDNKDQDLTEGIEKLSEGLSICNIRSMEEGINKLILFNKKDTADDEYVNLFKDTIKHEFEDLINDDWDVVDLIKWCLKKEQYQPALTLIESKMPYYIFNENTMGSNLINKDIQKQVLDDDKKKIAKKYDQKSKISGKILPTDVLNNIWGAYQNNRKSLSEYDSKNLTFPEWIFKFIDSNLKLNGTFYNRVKDGSLLKGYNNITFKNKTLVIKNCNPSVIVLLLLEKTLKKERNKINHSGDDAVSAKNIKDGICAYLYLLDQVKKL